MNLFHLKHGLIQCCHKLFELFLFSFGLNINEDRQENGYDYYEQNLSSTLGAVAAENWNFNPLQMTRNYFSKTQNFVVFLYYYQTSSTPSLIQQLN